MPTSDVRPRGVWRLVLLVLPVVLLALVAFVPAGTAEEKTPPPQAAPKPAPKDEYAGADTCIACHAEIPALLDQDWHGRRIAHDPGTRNCEECHGPSSHHTEDPAANHTFTNVKYGRAADTAQACLNCHQQRYRPADWRASTHARNNIACWSCHSNGKTPHELMQRSPDKTVCYTCHQDQKPTFELTSHHPVREGRLGCADCHDPHRPERTVTETNKLCVSCHTRQRGPFIFEHGAISGEVSEGCLDCHRAHGSPNERLLKFPGRALCLQCHADHALHFAPRLCWDCHKQHHGSNTSPLFLGP